MLQFPGFMTQYPSSTTTIPMSVLLPSQWPQPHSMSYSSPSDGESEALIIRKLDDLVQRIIVQNSTPDWLPFIPGSSFWVPPRRNNVKLVDLVRKLADQLSDEETLSLATDRGWPRSEFFINAYAGFDLVIDILLNQVVSDPSLTNSGVYWSWNKDSTSFENQLSQDANAEKAGKVWEVSRSLWDWPMISKIMVSKSFRV